MVLPVIPTLRLEVRAVAGYRSVIRCFSLSSFISLKYVYSWAIIPALRATTTHGSSGEDHSSTGEHAVGVCIGAAHEAWSGATSSSSALLLCEFLCELFFCDSDLAMS